MTFGGECSKKLESGKKASIDPNADKDKARHFNVAKAIRRAFGSRTVKSRTKLCISLFGNEEHRRNTARQQHGTWEKVITYETEGEIVPDS